jgi:hypothetical protein
MVDESKTVVVKINEIVREARQLLLEQEIGDDENHDDNDSLQIPDEDFILDEDQ